MCASKLFTEVAITGEVQENIHCSGFSPALRAADAYSGDCFVVELSLKCVLLHIRSEKDSLCPLLKPMGESNSIILSLVLSYDFYSFNHREQSKHFGKERLYKEPFCFYGWCLSK